MNKTNIGWTDYSSNLIKYRDPDGNVVNACVKASSGCANCYAETLAPRWGRKGKSFTTQNMKHLTPFFDEKEARVILGSKKLSGKRLFHGDMTDWMGPWVSDGIIDMVIAVMVLRSDVTFQTLTKHADRQLAYLSRFTDNQSHLSRAGCWASELAHKLIGAGLCKAELDGESSDGSDWLFEKLLTGIRDWPLPNLHLGVSAENQEWFGKRWDVLRRTPAAVRFLSLEPLLGRIDPQSQIWEDIGEFIWPDWTIIGGESGGGHRIIPIESITETIADFRAFSRVYVKQDSGPRPGTQGRIPDEFWIHEFVN